MNEKIKLTLPMANGGKQVITVPDDLQVSVDTLNKDLSEQPGLYGHFGLIASHAQGLRDLASQNLKDIMAAVETDIRDEVAKSGEKSTEAKIASRVQLHEHVIEARAALLKAERTASEAGVIKEAFYHRKDVLIALAANYRTEYGHPNSVK